MIMRQYLHADPVAASYLFGCGGTRGRGRCRSRRRHRMPYLQAADKTGMRIRYVIDTHVARRSPLGGPRIRRRLPAPITCSSPDAAVAFPFHRVRDGEVLELGNVTIKVLHTPGHTPEHISLLVTDQTRSEEPWFALDRPYPHGRRSRQNRTCHRCAKMAPAPCFEARAGSSPLPDYLEILPGAYSGSVCGRSLSGKPTSTIGFEKRHNKALAYRGRGRFRARHAGRCAAARRREAAQIRAINSGVMPAAAE